MTRHAVIIMLRYAVLFAAGAAVTVVLSLFLTRAQMLGWRHFTVLACAAAAVFTVTARLAR